MEKEIATQQQSATRLTAVEIRADVQLIQEVMKSVMIGPTESNPSGVHYGVIPGCELPSLYKPGAEKLASTFKLAADPSVDDLSTTDEFRYRVTVKLLHMVTGAFIGAGIGECSSNETKYKWRKPVCKEEFEEIPEDQKRIKWQVGFRGAAPKKINQIKVNSSDVANTILKMAKKRALIDAVLTATAASDIFTQDVEDLPSEILTQGGEQKGKPRVEEPKAVSLDDLRIQIFSTAAEYKGWLKETFKVSAHKDLNAKQTAEAIALLQVCIVEKKK